MHTLSERNRRIVALLVLLFAVLESLSAYRNRHRHPWLALADLVVAIVLSAGVIGTW